jgi:hypothetical protein
VILVQVVVQDPVGLVRKRGGAFAFSLAQQA